MQRAIVWFRQDLRLTDNPALCAALERYERVVPLYILPDSTKQVWSIGAAQNVWLHYSLKAFDESLRKRGSRLIIHSGDYQETLLKLIEQCSADAVFWNRQYEPSATKRDTEIKKQLRDTGITVESFNGALVHEPWTISTQANKPYKVFTPYWRNARSKPVDLPLSAPDSLPEVWPRISSGNLDEFELLPAIPWDSGIRESWQPGEDTALESLNAFCSETLQDYPSSRDIPGQTGTSRMSPHLHFGEISPRQIWHRVRDFSTHSRKSGINDAAEAFLRQIVWRDFAHHLLFHFPETPENPMDERFDKFEWDARHDNNLHAWQRGNTGVPMVDAGMRELWHTGWMHNRVRMIVASYLVKNLLIPWQKGADWFWYTLVDADLANNTMGWQWTSGCGVDAAPYFRVFNPVTQGKRFDPHGEYIRQWIPEIFALSNKNIHAPWETPEVTLRQCGIKLGTDYPYPLVDLKQSRKRALDRYAAIK